MLTPTAGTKTTSALAARAMAAVRRGHARPGPRGPADNGGDHPCRRLPVRSMASSPFPDFPVPEAIRDAVKSSVLDAATKEDSDFWRGHGQGGRGQGRTLRQGLGQRQAEAEGLEVGDSSSAVQGQGQGQGLGLGQLGALVQQPHGHIDDPISRERLLMLDDPLDEWYLDRSPSHIPGSLPPGVRPMADGADPFLLSKPDLDSLSESIRRDLIGTEHPVLANAAAYFFEKGQDGGKKVRPMMVMLLARAMAQSRRVDAGADARVDAVAGVDAVADAVKNTGINGSIGVTGGSEAFVSRHFSASVPFPMPAPLAWQRQDLPDAQRRLAEISEMIHTASLFHDDVIDGADTRRGAPSVHRAFGNKVAILAGDYLLARASIYLARLRDVEVVETMSTIIEHLVRGEVMQMKGTGDSAVYRERLVYYLRKNFYKTGSLMANSCKSAALLGGYDGTVVAAGYLYGKHVGMAFQLVDDVLDFDGSSSTMGKAALADLNAGLATAPVLFAAERCPEEMDALIERKFREEGDVARALELVRRSDGIERTKDLAQVYAELAVDAIMQLEPSPHRDSLVHLAYKVVDRVR